MCRLSCLQYCPLCCAALQHFTRMKARGYDRLRLARLLADPCPFSLHHFSFVGVSQPADLASRQTGSEGLMDMSTLDMAAITLQPHLPLHTPPSGPKHVDARRRSRTTAVGMQPCSALLCSALFCAALRCFSRQDRKVFTGLSSCYRRAELVTSYRGGRSGHPWIDPHLRPQQ